MLQRDSKWMWMCISASTLYEHECVMGFHMSRVRFRVFRSSWETFHFPFILHTLLHYIFNIFSCCVWRLKWERVRDDDDDVLRFQKREKRMFYVFNLRNFIVFNNQSILRWNLYFSLILTSLLILMKNIINCIFHTTVWNASSLSCCFNGQRFLFEMFCLFVCFHEISLLSSIYIDLSLGKLIIFPTS